VNIVYRSIQAAGGRTALCQALGVSLPTLARWRREGMVSDAQAVLRWAALLYEDPAAQLALARALAGLRRAGARARGAVRSSQAAGARAAPTALSRGPRDTG
jgi:hypothetical protein